MSLVSYEASSDEGSDSEDDSVPIKVVERIPNASASTKAAKPPEEAVSSQISDEEYDYVPESGNSTDELETLSTLALSLPKPINICSSYLTDEFNDVLTPKFCKLPMPKNYASDKSIVEEDDEFLHKKAIPPAAEEIPKPKPPPTKVPIKITIPSLKDFKDVDEDLAKNLKTKDTHPQARKESGLLSILPTAKSERDFSNATNKQDAKTSPGLPHVIPTKAHAFIPDTVKNKRPAYNTEYIDGINVSVKKPPKTVDKQILTLVNASDSEDSDEEKPVNDFFSLNTDEKLPEVSTNEINAMVAKRAAKIAEAATKYLDLSANKETGEAEPTAEDEDELRKAQKRYHEELDSDAVQALVGSSAKRQSKNKQNIQVMDISSDQVLPSRDEWMRTALASSTAFQPTGVLVDEEPATGTRRKHQITYLAHKAKANEAELQAMWSANRQNRRATQSKYGF